MIDQIAFALILFFSLIAFWRGFIKEIFGILGIFAIFYLTYKSNVLITALISKDANFFIKPLSLCAAFTFFVFFVSFINSKLIIFFDSIRKSSIDRFCGMLLGALKGMFFCFIIFLLIYSGTIIIHPELGIESNVKTSLPKCVLKSRIYPLMINAFEYFDGISSFDIKTKNGALYIRSSKKEGDESSDKEMKNIGQEKKIN